ncbi:hypothetical protein COCNU_14G009800 [Cocos nucifera]|uniref:Uncharacterized protein n=1 Tax=Cocos nucifera TaxID=13894 RepID=A0A8K0IVN0_COCNU|nr:hypothetical protein COCNU_14G009800 [Cocos nucifera]
MGRRVADGGHPGPPRLLFIDLSLLRYFPHALTFLTAVAPAAPLSALCFLYATAEVLYSSLALSFADGYFNVVVSMMHLSGLGQWVARRSKAMVVAAERARVLGEMVRVLKRDGAGVVWDTVCISEYA